MSYLYFILYSTDSPYIILIYIYILYVRACVFSVLGLFWYDDGDSVYIISCTCI